LKRNTLLIAVAAIALIGIAGGLLLAAGLQNGPLSGTLGPATTTLTLGATTIEERSTGSHLVRLDGKLSTLEGAGVAGRSVDLKWQFSTTTFAIGTVTTEADGTFTMTCEELANSSGTPFVYFAQFWGDSQYKSSQSASIQRT